MVGRKLNFGSIVRLQSVTRFFIITCKYILFNSRYLRKRYNNWTFLEIPSENSFSVLKITIYEYMVYGNGNRNKGYDPGPLVAGRIMI